MFVHGRAIAQTTELLVDLAHRVAKHLVGADIGYHSEFFVFNLGHDLLLLRDASGLRQQLYTLAFLATYAERLGDGLLPAVVGAGHLGSSSLVIERVCHVLLHRGEQVGVAERNVGCLVAHAFGNRESCETLVDEQAHMAVSQVVHPYLLI